MNSSLGFGLKHWNKFSLIPASRGLGSSQYYDSDYITTDQNKGGWNKIMNVISYRGNIIINLFEYWINFDNILPLILNPTPEGVQILWVGGVGELLKPPLRNHWWSGLRPHVAIDILFRYKFRVHMQKFGLLSQKLSEISRFQYLVILRFHVIFMYINCHNLKLQDSSFACKPDFTRRKNQILGAKS